MSGSAEAGIFTAFRVNDENLFNLYLFDRKVDSNAKHLVLDQIKTRQVPISGILKDENYADNDVLFATDGTTI